LVLNFDRAGGSVVHRSRVIVFVAAVIMAAACSQSQSPTSPSRTAAGAESPAATSALAAWAAQSPPGAIVGWDCFTRGIGCPMMPMAEPVFAADPPSAPTNLAFQVSGTTVILTWSPPGPGPDVRSYVVEAGTGPGLSNIARFDTGTTATTMTATDVPAGTYVVRVRAANQAGPGGSCGTGTAGPTPNTCMGAASNEVTIVVTTGPCLPPGAPTGLTQSVSGNTVTLQWNAFTGAIAYIIEAGSSSGATDLIVFDTGSAATSFSGSAPPGTYFIRIRVRTACGTSGVSNEVIATVGGAPPGPGVTGRWVGLVANGDGATSTPNECGVERWDWQLDLVQSGTVVTGTFTQTVVASGCDPAGRTQSVSLMGSVSGNNLTLTGNPSPGKRLDITATFSATRMTGTGLMNGGAFGRVTFAVNKQ
jgi:hypothetical protein